MYVMRGKSGSMVQADSPLIRTNHAFSCKNKHVWRRFDSIFVLCSTKTVERHAAIVDELLRIGIVDYNVVMQPTSPLDRLLADFSGFVYKEKLGTFSSTLGHYRILSTAYQLGHEHVLVIEDDVRCLHDLALLERIVADIPQDYACAKFEWISDRRYLPNYTYACRSGCHWIPLVKGTTRDFGTAGAGMIAYSHAGMANKIRMMEEQFAARSLDAVDGYDNRTAFTGPVYLAVPFAAIQSSDYRSEWGRKNYTWAGPLLGYGKVP